MYVTLVVACCLVLHVIMYVCNVYYIVLTSMYVFTGVLHIACLCMSLCVCFVDMFNNFMPDTVICLQLFVLSYSFHHFSSCPLNCLGK